MEQRERRGMGWTPVVVAMLVIAFVLGWLTNDLVADQVAQIMEVIR